MGKHSAPGGGCLSVIVSFVALVAVIATAIGLS